MSRACRMLSGLMVVILAAGCAVHDPQSAFQRAYRQNVLMPTPAAAGVSVQWFGVSTLLFRDEVTSILVDAYFSRPSAWRIVFDNLEPDPNAVNRALDEAGVDRVAAVFVAHAHHDHSLDAPALAREHSAVLHGSGSVLNLALGYGAPEERLRLIRPNIVRPVGSFRVTAIPTPHSETPFSLEPIMQPYAPPLHALAYGAGENYSFLIRWRELGVLVVTSAGYEKVSTGDAFGDERVGLVFLAIGSLGKRDDRFVCEFWEATVRQRGARRVVLIHWDAFTEPLNRPLRPFGWPLDDADRAYHTLQALSVRDNVEISFIKPGTPVDLAKLATRPQATIPQPADCKTW